MLSEVYQTNFFEFLDFLTKNNIKYWLMCGTLLGAYRDKNFIEHDDDVDIAVDVNDYEKVKTLILESQQYEIRFSWRREIAVVKKGYPSSESKIDIFFMDYDKNYAYIYSYAKNELTNKWDIEWRKRFTKSIFKDVIPYTFLGKTVYIPVGTEQLLTEHYNNWKEKNSKWNNDDYDSTDKDYREIAIIIPTLLRTDSLKNLINSIKKVYSKKWYRLYIADQGIHNLDNEEYYNQLREEGHYITYLPFNCGLSFSRNYLVKQTKEPYIFVVDDDFEFTTKTNPSLLIKVLLENSNIGVAGGKLENHGNYTYRLIHDKVCHRLTYQYVSKKDVRYTRKTHFQNPIPYYLCDIVLNFALFKREVFETCLWDESLKLVEHTDFYLRLKDTKWAVAFCPEVTAIHCRDRKNADYVQLRTSVNCNPSLELYLKKWGFKEEMITYITEG